jgi:hypothetical protein
MYVNQMLYCCIEKIPQNLIQLIVISIRLHLFDDNVMFLMIFHINEENIYVMIPFQTALSMQQVKTIDVTQCWC